MINRIIIDNFATIEHLSFDLTEGLNIITGETGAGKSVLVEASVLLWVDGRTFPWFEPELPRPAFRLPEL